MNDPPTPKVTMQNDILGMLASEEAPMDQSVAASAGSVQRDEGQQTGRHAKHAQQNEYSRMGGLMKAIFADGLRLENEEDFAVFYLYARVVEHVSRFGSEGMRDPEAIHGVSTYAALLENRVILHR